ncbi:MAG TPA: hypothetical protein VEL76_02315 [Gemmataceae bacterium]|nr:hypothetical protein [Gemmataceae bacterium]
MAKPSSKKRKGKSDKPKVMPLLAMAIFCERVLEEKDNVLTIVRVVDRLIVPKPPELPPAPKGEPPPQLAVPLPAVIMFKSGDAKGEYPFRIEIVWPSGRRLRAQDMALTFLGAETGFNLRTVVPIPVDEEGLYWYEVFLQEHLVTRMPLRIEHSSQIADGATTEQSQASEGEG